MRARTRGRRALPGKAATAAICAFSAMALGAAGAQAAAPVIKGTHVTHVTSTGAVLEAKINPNGAQAEYHFEYGTAPCPSVSCVSVPVPDEVIASGSSAVEVKAPTEALQPSTVYHYRVVASNPAIAEGPDRLFATYGPTFEGLPDGRAYEQASPVNKNGGDIQGQEALVKATPNGDGIAFGSDFGIPGGKGFGALPTYLATRGTSNWSTVGLLPPPGAGERINVIGRSPDYSRIYSQATRLQTPRLEALVEQSSKGGPVTVIAPYAADANDSFAGETADGSVVFFEAKAKLPPKEGGTPIAAATEGISNLYAWDRESGEVHLAGIFNQGEGAPKGSFAGPYDWSVGSNAYDLNEGGGERFYYLPAMHAITPEGNIYFTAAGTGQLYLRVNPTKAPSPLNGQGKCEDHQLACTIPVSASQKTNGTGKGGADSVGPQPAAFQGATKDGSQVFFTSSEKLTNDANTGPEQPLAAIGSAKLGTTAEDINPEFLKELPAVGIARHGSWFYWANPAKGQIGRIGLNAEEGPELSTLDLTFIAPPPSEGECEEEANPITEPGVFTPVAGPIPSEPRYLAVDATHVYWTNTGRRSNIGVPMDGAGTIGRATLNGSEAVEPGTIEPAFICGEEPGNPGERLASNPQGIAVGPCAGGGECIYWANAAQLEAGGGFRTIARAKIDGSGAKERFILPPASETPYGVTLDASHLYYASNDEANNLSSVTRTNLEGKEEKFVFTGDEGLRGLAVDASHVYWATQGEGDSIGRCNLELEECTKKYVDVEGAANGLAAGATHLFWAVNGDAAKNPGNDLYRYEAKSDTLTDLTALASHEIEPGKFENENGAEVQGMLGASADGSHIYFTANGVLAAGAVQGDCKGPVSNPSGKCNLYAWHEGQVSFIAPLNEDGGSTSSDAYNWVGTPYHVPDPSSYLQRTSFLGNGGKVLVFRSQEQLTEYENTPADASCSEVEGQARPCPEFYRYDAEEPGQIRCLTCRPSGEDTEGGPQVGSVKFAGFRLVGAMEAFPSRNLSADGERFFFETPEALSPADTNGDGEGEDRCRLLNGFPACLDVYEWVATGSTPQCQEGSPGYSLLDEGCVYLISTGKSHYPSFFADASEDGSNAFFLTRQSLVGQDKDELQDVYGARIGGGLPAQNQTPLTPCESTEACHGPAAQAPAEGTPATPAFNGPGNVVEKRKPKKHKGKKKHKKQGHHKQKSKHRAEKAKGGSGR